ncbi:hypothetical protein BK704_28785 [[Bacillus thuringiensis] serovar konkukian]|nr:hypothetical protein [Bacillus thuringiensis]MED1304578.1 hypothetical protein [Bacillus pacificus]OUA91551.1 hypothetical protein BK704_35005 [[Bacillus thuringiensis] serovar konkukian]OUA91642.1 hypothetical protein BK704_34775 [[Bacillus thuringiensis] serovar konkukian]OUA94854.1 hypothetical protein BK704_28785 [[Bacillus thuringiensis] serovar konkukian]
MDKDAEKLKDLYARAAGLDESLPGDLLQKLKIYGDILSLTGKLHASALSDWKMAEAIRKETISKCFTYNPNGTAKEREMQAEFAASEHRKAEAQAEASCMRWRNAYNSTTEIINILKIQLRDMKDLNSGGV